MLICRAISRGSGAMLICVSRLEDSEGERAGAGAGAAMARLARERMGIRVRVGNFMVGYDGGWVSVGKVEA